MKPATSQFAGRSAAARALEADVDADEFRIVRSTGVR